VARFVYAGTETRRLIVPYVDLADTEIATCPANNDVQVYTRGGPDGWELNQTLSEVRVPSSHLISIKIPD
jgi:hypothetical protein